MSQAQLFVELFQLVREEFLLLLHLEEAGNAGRHRFTGKAWVIAGSSGEHSGLGQKQQGLRRSGGGFAKGGGVVGGEGCGHRRE